MTLNSSDGAVMGFFHWQAVGAFIEKNRLSLNPNKRVFGPP